MLKLKLYKHYCLYLAFSSVMILIGLWSLIFHGLNLGIDFTGGSLLEIQLGNNLSVDENQIRQVLAEKYQLSTLQIVTEDQFIIRGEQIDQSRQQEIINLIQTEIAPDSQVLRFETVGPTMGSELFTKTINGIIIAAVVLVLYLFYRFKEIKYGFCALLGVVHDTFILIGLFSIFGAWLGVEIDVMFVTALLTTISFSVHDTIVMYDRIREVSQKNPALNYKEVVSQAVNQTLVRSLNNSLAVIFMLVALVWFGGTSLRWFGIALLSGVVLGTYSSPFVSIPLLLWWDDICNRRRFQKESSVLCEKKKQSSLTASKLIQKGSLPSNQNSNNQNQSKFPDSAKNQTNQLRKKSRQKKNKSRNGAMRKKK